MSEKPAVIKGKLYETKKRPWTKPVLRPYGKVRTVTLGGSPGTGESGDTRPNWP